MRDFEKGAHKQTSTEDDGGSAGAAVMPPAPASANAAGYVPAAGAVAGEGNAAAAEPSARPLPALLDVVKFPTIPSSPGDFYYLEASDALQTQQGNAVAGNKRPGPC